ncbi:MAG: hypothetical protein EOP87_18205, partial [Verrucomicrobiaceae bacterium]
MKTLIPAFTATLAISMAASAAPRLVVSTPTLVPESQVDLVLDSPVTAIPDLGKTVDNTWMEIQPALPGKLLWKAQNIARFIPAQPPAIGTNYTFSIPKNLRHLDKSPVPAGKFASLESETFRVVVANASNRWSSDFSPSTGEWQLVFNDDVDPAAAGNYISFVSQSGQRVAAKLSRTTYSAAGYYGTNHKPWSARFPDTPAIQNAPDAPVLHIIRAVPASPLPVGTGWVVSVLKGLPNLAGKARVTEDTTYSIGDVKPFQVAGIQAYQNPDEPRKILIQFNQTVPASLPVDFLAKSIEMSPRPDNLSAEAEGKQITLTGDFDEIEKATVTFRPPYVSASGLDLEGPLTKEIKFGNFIPVLSFPSQDQAQLANGSRSYRMLTLNVESAHVRIKKLSGADQIRAFQGYRHVTGLGHDGKSIEPTITLPYSLIVGEQVADLNIPLDTPLDHTKVTTLKWDELLPKEQRTGTFFLEAEGSVLPGYEGNGTAPVTQAIIQLTDIGLAWKLAGEDAFIYAFSCDTGAPLPGVKVEVFGEDALSLDTATTDASGIARLPRTSTARHLRASLGSDNYLT